MMSSSRSLNDKLTRNKVVTLGGEEKDDIKMILRLKLEIEIKMI